ncbi:PRC-barrel domain-containing protein [Phyllobacterium sp. 0TCS1.6C]|jgi:sporulation protein YlmC with PRC-barrel domain|uniref:PRC-barrel domain-containing protein n=1 Tax=unclassified Phyllobacterium TaxID=2638441 RepID=UPI002264B6E0|nr:MULTISPECIES: PRC-barrel domain-containing protein [unclassified Phyllobacterium]MCX8280401.1 PRC-barrel domain-containing protein [Phyllobacterium sp. 0TCS1.6C]MCX8295150.1 PRC-barrel domain-containing protein [Phyllobacterium sp. 0TCS1.6A]
MLKSLIASTAAVTLMAGTALAQTTPAPAPAADPAPAKVETKELFTGGAGAATAADVQPMTKVEEGQLLASGLMGKNVYNGDSENAESIGEVKDLIVNADGTVKAAVIGVGGFLGVGEKAVALPADQLKISMREDKSNWIVVNTTKEKLKEAPAFETADSFTQGVADPMKASESNAADTATPAAPAPAGSSQPATPAAPAQ